MQTRVPIVAGCANKDVGNMSSTRYAKLLIDSADSLAETRTAQDAWDAAVKICRRIGAKDVNCGAIMRDSRELAWLRSSMDPRWLRAYHQARFYEVDAILDACKAGTPQQFVDVPRHFSAARTSRRRDMFGCLLDFEYRYILAQTWITGETERTVVLSCEDDPKDLYGRGTERAFRAISAMLSLAILPPGDEMAQDWACGSPWSRLSAKERDVLSYLAHGMEVHEIAERFVITEEQARRRLLSACRTLGVAAPEQALSLAMARGVLSL
ncbi:Autoinducer binding domain-containing protein [Alloyangia pacifica]|uniref:Autoinducer binding domain-containing protein n=2 Tax=Alloyangia pacifica TaxID=311180 RepID=A0A1I6RNQ5_9RHOB|nr:Autoinducer binding domain-containing protein [Alloyangia pacifica]SFS66240.1 Autoinducer binding domain-containing protein [Alloyangia pacifica]